METATNNFKTKVKDFFSKTSKKIKLEKKVGIITNAGGAGALMADYLSEANLKIEKPVDLIGTALASDYKYVLRKIKEKNIIVILTPQKMTEIEKTAKIIIFL